MTFETSIAVGFVLWSCICVALVVLIGMAARKAKKATYRGHIPPRPMPAPPAPAASDAPPMQDEYFQRHP